MAPKTTSVRVSWDYPQMVRDEADSIATALQDARNRLVPGEAKLDIQPYMGGDERRRGTVTLRFNWRETRHLSS